MSKLFKESYDRFYWLNKKIIVLKIKLFTSIFAMLIFIISILSQTPNKDYWDESSTNDSYNDFISFVKTESHDSSVKYFNILRFISTKILHLENKFSTQDKTRFKTKIHFAELTKIKNNFRFWVNVNRDYQVFSY